MKPLLILLALSAPLLAAPAVLSPEVLAEIKRNSPMAKLEQPTPDEAPVSRPKEQSLINDSVILNDGTRWTLVPKGAVIHIPKSMQDKVNGKAEGKLVAWEEFSAQNRGWISTFEISFDQATGKTPIDPKKVEFLQKQDKVMVAVHQGGPISTKIAAESTSTQTAPQQ